jgi:deoxyribonuclease-4
VSAALPLGAHTFGMMWDTTAPEAVRRLGDLGFTRFELIASPPHLDLADASHEQSVAMRAALEATGGEILALDLPGNDINLGSPSPEMRAFTLGLYRAAVDRAAEFGAPWVVVLAGRRHGLLPPPDGRLVEGFEREMDRLAPYAEKRGVRLLLEIHPQTLLPGAAALSGYVERAGHPNLDILYDVPNAIAAGEDPCAGLLRCRDHLAMVHLSDAPRGDWKHDPIGSGDVDFEAVHRQLAVIDFRGPVVLEVIAADAARRLADGRDRLAAAGWSFM